MTKAEALKIIDLRSSVFTDVSDKIWEYAELSLLEFRSAELYCKVLEENDFKVERNIAGIKTAFSGRYGSGRPYIGILAEFDALSGLSQAAGTASRQELVPGACGHGCGHNMLGAGSLAAAFAVKEYLSKSGRSGTVIFYGCPGEEGGAGKAFMARDELWRELDAALTWHPEDLNRVCSESSIACIQKEYKFTGIAAHAAGNPDMGRSGLDAVQLMNIGVEFLREHMSSQSRIHYAITDAGGNSPNVVQPYAQVLYMVRAPKVQEALKLQARVDKIAEAAAMMTETKLTVRFIDGTANVINNVVLEKLMYKNFLEVGAPVHDADEIAFAQAIVDSYETKPAGIAESLRDELCDEHYDEVMKASGNGEAPLFDFIVPYEPSRKIGMGSTDVGDVSWQTPTAQINTCCFAANSPGHSWQNVSVGRTSIGHKGLLCAGKIIAGTAIDIFDDPSILNEAKSEFERRTRDGYLCPIPADAAAVAVGGKIE